MNLPIQNAVWNDLPPTELDESLRISLRDFRRNVSKEIPSLTPKTKKEIFDLGTQYTIPTT